MVKVYEMDRRETEARIKWASKIIDQKVRKLLMTAENYKKKLII